LSVEEAIQTSKKSSSFLIHMLTMMDPQQIKSNEIAKVSIMLLYEVYTQAERLKIGRL
jgi:hypothetical protein